MKTLSLFLVIFIFGGICHSHTKTNSSVLNSYPIDKAQYVHPGTNIGFNFSSPIQKNSLLLDSIIVTDSKEKRYQGSLHLSSNRRTVIFIPSENFTLAEEIHVHLGSLRTDNEEMTSPFSLSFTIRSTIAVPDANYYSDDPITEDQLHGGSNNLGENTFHDLPQSMPEMNVLVNNHPSDGYIYLTGHAPVPYAAVVDKNGKVVSLLQNKYSQYKDFKPYPDGSYSFYDDAKKTFRIVDTSFSPVDSISICGKYIPDYHEMRKTREGHYIFIGLDYIKVDMRKNVVGTADSNALIFVPIVLEYDNGRNLVFEWRSIDHFKITDATHENLHGSAIDFCHMNAIEFDADSNLLLSSRNMDEITKIDHTTGNIVWRLGGKNNQFTLVGDTVFFSHQHAIRRTDKGTYTLFDNGVYNHLPLQFSRAMEFRIDPAAKVATKIWEFRHTPDLYCHTMGYAQRLPNNNTLIGWGECNSVSVTEVGPNNTTVFEMAMPYNDFGYRAYKYDVNYVHGTMNPLSSASASLFETHISCIPNPLREKGLIHFSLAEEGNVTIALFDQLGREVSNIYSGYLSQGPHEFTLNADLLTQGTYNLSAQLGSSASNIKIVVLK